MTSNTSVAGNGALCRLAFRPSIAKEIIIHWSENNFVIMSQETLEIPFIPSTNC